MLTREIADCLERLRGPQQCLDAVLDTPGKVSIEAAVFLAIEIGQAIDDLDHHMPTARMIKPEAIERLTRFPEDMTGDDDKGEGAA